MIYFCVKTYTAAVVSGNYSENLTSTWPDAHHRFSPSSFPRFPRYTIPLRTYLAPPPSFSVDDATLRPPNDPASYSVDTLTFAFLREWFYDYLKSIIEHGRPDLSNPSTMDVAEAIYAIQRQSYGTGVSAAAFFSEKVANGLTLTVRNLGTAGMRAQGDARENATFVQARWMLAVLPIALVCCTASVMAATLWITFRHGVPIWKSSAIATLAQGLQDGAGAGMTAGRLDVLERKASGEHMTVEAGPRQPRFVVPTPPRR